jgi:hypothetical protein
MAAVHADAQSPADAVTVLNNDDHHDDESLRAILECGSQSLPAEKVNALAPPDEWKQHLLGFYANSGAECPMLTVPNTKRQQQQTTPKKNEIMPLLDLQQHFRGSDASGVTSKPQYIALVRPTSPMGREWLFLLATRNLMYTFSDSSFTTNDIALSQQLKKDGLVQVGAELCARREELEISGFVRRLMKMGDTTVYKVVSQCFYSDDPTVRLRCIASPPSIDALVAGYMQTHTGDFALPISVSFWNLWVTDYHVAKSKLNSQAK